MCAEPAGQGRRFALDSCRLWPVIRLATMGLACVCGCLMAPAAFAQLHALQPHAAGHLRKLLHLDEPIEGPGGEALWLSAAIEQDRVVVRAAKKGGPGKLAVTLFHPDDAPTGGRKVGDLALVLTPGPAPEHILDQVIARLEARDGVLPWVTIEAAPSVEALLEPGMEAGGPGFHWPSAAGSAGRGLDFMSIDAMLDDGATDAVRRALASMDPPEDVLGLAGLALRWRLA
ncbi:MAG: hypothetical protein QF464_04200, partial [Myxococcota bacterium]|nr:hypothetical protein [Myxococcota bacterium]